MACLLNSASLVFNVPWSASLACPDATTCFPIVLASGEQPGPWSNLGPSTSPLCRFSVPPPTSPGVLKTWESHWWSREQVRNAVNHHESAAQTFPRLGQKLLCKWFHSIAKISVNMWFLSFLVPTKQCKITGSETTCQSLGDAQVINEMASKLYRVFLQWVIGTPKIRVKLVWKTIFPLEIAYFQLACAGCFGCKPIKQHQNNKIKAPKSRQNRNSRVARNETHLQRADLLLGK